MKENKRSIVETVINYMKNNFEERTREKGYIWFVVLRCKNRG
tara:strand:- start:1892 stop:2017 length:126 start_codon:yes stop_codon:yes gene_type:complete